MRSHRRIRTAIDRQAHAPLCRVRRQDHLAVRTRHDGTRDLGPLAGDVCGGSIAAADQHGQRINGLRVRGFKPL